MTFHEAMNRAFYIRQEDGKIREPLERCEAYRDAAQVVKILIDCMDQQTAEAATVALRQLCDLEANYFYRVGLQDGISLTAADFPVQGIA